MRKGNDDIRVMLETIRTCQNNDYKTIINENKRIIKENDENENAIAITDDPKFGQNALTNQINQFRSAVESGAQFTKPGEVTVSESPLKFIPSTTNLIFSGIIPCLNNLKFQFVLRTSTGNGCFIWADELILNKDNIQILNKLYGFYLNWKEEWGMQHSDLEKLNNMINGGY